MSSNNNENNASAKPAGSTINPTLAAADFEIPWVEKYRPQRIEDIVGNEEAVLRLKAIAEDGNMPNLILAGPPGIGKTTSVLCLAHALLGKDFKEAVLELNASDERTLDVVRTKIKNFAQKKVTLPPGRHKIVILDEADSMTKESQQAMRRTMEIYSNSTRFALACNNSSDIIEPIQSRCAILRFSRLSDHQILKRLIEVCDQEKVNYTEDGLQALIFTAEGDLRNALNNLQSTHAGFGLVNAENVFKVCDHPHPMIVKQIIEHCINYELMNAQEKLTYLIHRGYSPQDIISTFFRVVRSYDMSEDRQIEFMKEIGNTHVRVLDGVETPLQMSGLLARLCKLAKATQ